MNKNKKVSSVDAGALKKIIFYSDKQLTKTWIDWYFESGKKYNPVSKEYEKYGQECVMAMEEVLNE